MSSIYDHSREEDSCCEHEDICDPFESTGSPIAEPSYFYDEGTIDTIAKSSKTKGYGSLGKKKSPKCKNFFGDEILRSMHS